MKEAVKMWIQLEDLAIIKPDAFKKAVAIEVSVVGDTRDCGFDRGDLPVEPNELRHVASVPPQFWP